MSWLTEDQDARNAALAAGFTWQPPHTLTIVNGLLPFAGLRALSDCPAAVSLAFGRGEVWFIDIDYTSTGTHTVMRSGPHEGYHGVGVQPHTETSTGRVNSTLVAIRHPDAAGSADILPDWKGTTSGAVVNALLWVPPFTLLKAFQYAAASDNPDREIGNEDFDHRYLVHAESEDRARLAVTPALGECIAAANARGRILLRPGRVLVQLDPPEPGADGFQKRFGFVRALVAALDRQR